MRVLQRLRHQPVGFNMTPMIDVVFLLIIFFLVSSHLARRENRIDVELPSAASGQDDAANQDESRRLTLTVQRDGNLWLAGQQIGVDQVAARLKDHQKRQSDPLELRVRCDRQVPYRDVEPLLSQAVGAGIWQVSFAVLQPDEVLP